MIGGFGKVILGQNDYAHDSFIVWAPTHRGGYTSDDAQFGVRDAMGESVASSHFSGNASYNDSNKVTYMSPSLGGFKFGASITDGSDENGDVSFGGAYTGSTGGMMDDGMMSGIGYTIKANSFDNGEDGDDASKSNHVGISLDLDSITLTYGQSTSETGGDDASDVSSSGFGVGFDLSDSMAIGVGTSSSEDDASKDQTDVITLSTQYTIVPGLSAAAAYNSFEVSTSDPDTRNNEGTEVILSIQANF